MPAPAPGARLGDPTLHGNPLTPPAPGASGSPNVFIGKQPAWRATADVHVCPLVSGVVPHVGGVVAPGSLTVRINKLGAARQGETIAEAGPPNKILMGFPTVIIGG